MISFENDYSEGAHERILERLMITNREQTVGYGMDPYCKAAADTIRKLCKNESLNVHFLVGGTQANKTVIASALRPYQGVLCADTGHINTHETGAIEATGHKALALPAVDGKISADQVDNYCKNGFDEHVVHPGMVYISQPTELGTLYTLDELTALSEVCRKYKLPLFADGARLAYGLMAEGNDVQLEDLARLCDVFYIGGTKVGALFGEAVVMSNPDLHYNFRCMIKQNGGMLAKGRLLGLQFLTLLEDGLYFELGAHADRLAMKLKNALLEKGYPLVVEATTNQIFPIFPDSKIEELSRNFRYCPHERIDETHSAIRFCTSWATCEEDVDALIAAL